MKDRTILKLLLCTICICLFLSVSQAFAITDSTSTSVKKTRPVYFISSSQNHVNELSIWAGYSYDSMRLWGKTTNTTLETVGLQYNRKFLKFYNHNVEYNLRVIYSKYDYPEFKIGHPRNTLSGFGISPLGFQINFREHKTVHPFLNSSGGIMLLDGPFPDRRGKKFNFTFSAGAGLEFILSQSASFSVGIKFHHLSNFERGEINPGVDSGLLYTAFTIF